MNIINDAIKNIAFTTEAIEKYCNDPKNYNSYGAHLLEQVVRDLRNQESALKEINYSGGFYS